MVTCEPLVTQVKMTYQFQLDLYEFAQLCVSAIYEILGMRFALPSLLSFANRHYDPLIVYRDVFHGDSRGSVHDRSVVNFFPLPSCLNR